jgi:hypothetical protein
MVPKLLVLGLAGMLAFAASRSQKIFPFDYVQEDLPNGLRLVTVPTDFPNIVAVYIVVQTGSRNEIEEGKTGFAHLFEHIMFKGTEKFPQAVYERVHQQRPHLLSRDVLERGSGDDPDDGGGSLPAAPLHRARVSHGGAGSAGRVQQEQHQPVPQAR